MKSYKGKSREAVTIKSIRRTPCFSKRYDIQVKDNENFFAGSILVHNCRLISIVYPNGRVDQFSRNGKELLNFEHTKDQLRKHFEGKLGSPLVLDGEIVSDSFQNLMKEVHRKESVEAKDAKLYLFDTLLYEEFCKGISTRTQIDRRRDLNNFFKGSGLQSIRVLDYTVVDLSKKEGWDTFNKLNVDFVEKGFEGIMIKDVGSFYECKRSSSWLKLKPFIEVSLKVIGVEEGTGKNENSLGSLICEGFDLDKNIRVSVGGGFTDLQRKEFWNSKDKVINQIVEVRADTITKNQDNEEEGLDLYSLRFPRFLRFRGFEVEEKL